MVSIETHLRVLRARYGDAECRELRSNAERGNEVNSSLISSQLDFLSFRTLVIRLQNFVIVPP